VILPELGTEPAYVDNASVLDRTLRMLSALQQPSFELACAGLLHSLPADPVTQGICRRLKLSNEETDRITWLVAHQNDLIDAPAQSLARLKRTLAHPYRDDLVNLLRVKLLAEEADLQPVLFCDEYLASTPQSVIDPPPLISGDDLKRQGLNPGPAFKRILESVRDAQLNLQISTAAEALLLAEKLANQAPG
jgi:poly(A) polymerase